MSEEPENPCHECEFYSPKSFGRGWCTHKDAGAFAVVGENHTCDNFSQRDWEEHLKERKEAFERIKKHLKKKQDD
jgi:hypothetical protein